MKKDRVAFERASAKLSQEEYEQIHAVQEQAAIEDGGTMANHELADEMNQEFQQYVIVIYGYGVLCMNMWYVL